MRGTYFYTLSEKLQSLKFNIWIKLNPSFDLWIYILRKEIVENTSWNTRNTEVRETKYTQKKVSIIFCFDGMPAGKKPVFPFFETEKKFSI